MSLLVRCMMTSYAIVPAAGRSSRMGSPKLLLPWGTGTIIENVLVAWRASAVDHVLAVVHPKDELLAMECRRCGATTIVPETPPPEMKDSVAAALEYIRLNLQPADNDVWLLAPADMPTLSVETIDALLNAYTSQQPRILVPTHGGRRGHPVLFRWALADEVDGLGEDEGVNVLLQRHPVEEVECPSAEIAEDIDTPRQYHELVQRHGKS